MCFALCYLKMPLQGESGGTRESFGNLREAAGSCRKLQKSLGWLVVIGNDLSVMGMGFATSQFAGGF